MSAPSHSFTSLRWAGLDGGRLDRATGRGRFWNELHDLATEAFETTRDYCPLSRRAWGTLVSAAASGLPVVLEREDSRATYVVESISSLAPGVSHNLYVRRWGFAYPLSLRLLLDVTTPEIEYRGRLAERVHEPEPAVAPTDEPVRRLAAWYDSDVPSDRLHAIVLWSSGALTRAHRSSPYAVWSAPSYLTREVRVGGELLSTASGWTLGEAQARADEYGLDPYVVAPEAETLEGRRTS